MSGDDTGWVRVAARGDLGDGDVLGVVAGGHDIALYEMDGTVYATDDICSHAYAKLSDGWLDHGEIECPLHAGRFDVKTGKATAPPCIDSVRVYTVRVSGDDIEVKLD
ncbi:MAG: non-heme iron oxygenase ferredoxin subunit [Alphaproteobacteria bacterium]|nr:non-heme iron oxygenase ferredoxin subunit [Alphaproteobacteria bacterium]